MKKNVIELLCVIDIELKILKRRGVHDWNSSKTTTREKEVLWTGKIVDLVELIYALDIIKCVDNGNINIENLAKSLGYFFGVEIKHCFNTYMDIKKRKGDSRTYFLDELSKQLNDRMEADDIKMRERR